MQVFSKRDGKSLTAINRLLLGLGIILAVGTLAMGAALGIYTFFFFVVILDDFAVSVVAQQFYVNAIFLHSRDHCHLSRHSRVRFGVL